MPTRFRSNRLTPLLLAAISLAACSIQLPQVSPPVSPLRATPSLSAYAIVQPTFPRPWPTSTPPCHANNVESTIPEPNEPSRYIGLHFSSIHLPDGLTLLEATGGNEWGYLKIQASFALIWLVDRLECRDSQSRPYSRVHDALFLPPPQDGMTYPDFCSLNGEQILPIAYGSYNPEAPPVPVPWGIQPINYGWPLESFTEAWQIDPITHRFAPLPLEALECVKMAR